MYTHVFIIILSISSCFCYAGYALFQGFNVSDVKDTSDVETETYVNSILNEKSATPLVRLQVQNTAMPIVHPQDPQAKISTNINVTTLTTKSEINGSRELTSTFKYPIETTSIRPMRFTCPEDEKPSHIGPYEIPTQRDIVLFTRTMLLDMFNTYNKEAFYLLKDIRAATKATSSIQKKCEGNKVAYKQCVKRVSKQCQQITKNLVTAIENQKQEILNVTKVQICNLSQMTTDPIELLQSLAQDKVSLQFALPGFLRLLNSCSILCVKSDSETSYYRNKPMRRMTDQELVIKHFLTGKNYLELIMDSKHRTIANSN